MIKWSRDKKKRRSSPRQISEDRRVVFQPGADENGPYVDRLNANERVYFRSVRDRDFVEKADRLAYTLNAGLSR